MLGKKTEDLVDFLINAYWNPKKGLMLDFNLEAIPHIKVGETITIGSKVFKVLSTEIVDNKLSVNTKGLVFELLHFKRLNKCLD